MKTILRISYTWVLVSLFGITSVSAQVDSIQWNLRNCIQYALQHNLEVSQVKLKPESSEAGYQQAKSAILPNLNASASQSYDNGKSLDQLTGNYTAEDYYSGSYGITSEVNLFNGFKSVNNIQQQVLYVKSDELAVKEAENNIEIAVTQAYLQVVSDKEALKQAQQTLDASTAQLERTKILYDAGSLAASDYAQIKSQYSSDKYALVIARNAFDQSMLNIRHLLELNSSETFNIQLPEMDDHYAQLLLPDKEVIFQSSFRIMPEIEISSLGIKSAELDYKMAKAGFLPSLSVSAGIGSGYNSKNTDIFSSQLDHNFGQNIGLNLAIPIFSRKQNHYTLVKSRLNIESAKIIEQTARKNLTQTIERVYLDAVSAQARFVAAIEQKESAQVSYELLDQQFSAGLKNTVELITEKSKYLNAQQEYLKAKYTAILDYKLLDFYQGKPIEL